MMFLRERMREIRLEVAGSIRLEMEVTFFLPVS